MPIADSQSLSTCASLLDRAKTRDAAAWAKLANLYSPMVYRWARKAGLQPVDAQDVVQSVFMAVASDLGRFRRSQPGDSFRGWLWTICRHKTLDLIREKQHQVHAAGGTTAHYFIQQFADAGRCTSEERDETCRLRHRAMALLRDHFEDNVWLAFHRVVVHGDHPAHVARDLGISIATVYRAKVRVLVRLQTELGCVISDSVRNTAAASHD